MTMRTLTRCTLAALAVVALAGCGDGAGKAGAEKSAAGAPAEVSNKTLAATLQADRAYGGLAKVLANSGLEAALEGVGPYTVLAPPDSALTGPAGGDLTDPAMKAEGAALMRAHILPGAITRADIAAAVDWAAGKGVQMRTMGGGMLTFTRNGQDLVATAPDGASARLTGRESLVSNGVVQPIEGILVKPSVAAQ